MKLAPDFTILPDRGSAREFNNKIRLQGEKRINLGKEPAVQCVRKGFRAPGVTRHDACNPEFTGKNPKQIAGKNVGQGSAADQRDGFHTMESPG
jgi:hypothetical protein